MPLDDRGWLRLAAGGTGNGVLQAAIGSNSNLRLYGLGADVRVCCALQLLLFVAVAPEVIEQ